jgi:hypothetical protein
MNEGSLVTQRVLESRDRRAERGKQRVNRARRSSLALKTAWVRPTFRHATDVTVALPPCPCPRISVVFLCSAEAHRINLNSCQMLPSELLSALRRRKARVRAS